MALSFLALKKGEEAVGMVISLTGLAGVAMVTGKDNNKHRNAKKKELRIILYY